jgi:lipoprotein-anchoring transpeptidase ErfK/SrfK
MPRLINTAAVALALTCFALPANASTERSQVPFFLAPLFAPLQVASAQPSSAPEQQYELAQAPRTSTTREVVTFSGNYAPGTIVINTAERRLYLVMAGGKAMRYAVGVGREGFQWAGTQTISNKQQWPDWRPPEEMLRRRPDLPRFMRGGPENPLGARAMYLGGSLYRIHGSNEPETIGRAVSSGCIRMLNSDVVDLYERVKIGTQVVVLR